MRRRARSLPWRALAVAATAGACTEGGVVLEPPGAPGPAEPGVVRADSLAAGPYHTCGIQDGRLACWGANDQGQLGIGEMADRTTPAPVAGEDWAEIVAGEHHSCARRLGGSLWCWGANDEGQLGIGPAAAQITPVFVSIVAPIAQLGSTYAHTCAVDQDGALWCWGANEEGQLAQGDPFPDPGVDRDRPVRVGAANDWMLVDGGQGHSCGIRAPGHLYCWGRNLLGELGLGEGAPGQLREPQRVGDAEDWTDVRVGQNTSCGLRGAGELCCWGDNAFGETGHGDMQTRLVPTRVGAFADWTSITLDTFHACGVRANGELHCWGRNTEGQLGSGDTTDHASPMRVGDAVDWASVAAGRFHTCARKRDGAVLCTGQNSRGQLGAGDLETRLVFTPVAIAP